MGRGRKGWGEGGRGGEGKDSGSPVSHLCDGEREFWVQTPGWAPSLTRISHTGYLTVLRPCFLIYKAQVCVS